VPGLSALPSRSGFEEGSSGVASLGVVRVLGVNDAVEGGDGRAGGIGAAHRRGAGDDGVVVVEARGDCGVGEDVHGLEWGEAQGLGECHGVEVDADELLDDGVDVRGSGIRGVDCRGLRWVVSHENDSTGAAWICKRESGYVAGLARIRGHARGEGSRRGAEAQR